MSHTTVNIPAKVNGAGAQGPFPLRKGVKASKCPGFYTTALQVLLPLIWPLLPAT